MKQLERRLEALEQRATAGTKTPEMIREAAQRFDDYLARLIERKQVIEAEGGEAIYEQA